MDQPSDHDRRIARVAALDQRLRRELYRLLAATGGWTSRDAAAAALGVPRSVAAFHLDKLADAGVVEVRFERTSGRQGPGAGRPSKLYRPCDDEVAASIPDRHYDLAGSLLAAAVARSTQTGVAVRDCLRDVAHGAGHEVGEEAARAPVLDPGDDVPTNDARTDDARTDDARSNDAPTNDARTDDVRTVVLDALERHGYEPDVVGEEIAMANCPFHRLADEHRELVCGMNLDFVDGLLHGAGSAGRLVARLDPRPGWCCVRISTG